MKLKYFLTLYALLICNATIIAQSLTDDNRIVVTFLQLNDVYEISPLNNGTEGGMARAATIRNKLLKENANTYTVMSGDFLFPSALGTIKYEGKRIKGRQMVETMNTAGIDLVTFGNHEFDLDENELTERLHESSFDWVCANVLHHTASGNEPFTVLERHSLEDIPSTRILVFSDADGTIVRIGVFGITINSTAPEYVIYEDYYTAAAKAIQQLQGQCDFIVAVTHLTLEDDHKLAQKFPEIKLIIGGHEHVHNIDTVGNTIIAKADANAKTVYVHSLVYNTNTKNLSIQSVLTAVDETIPEDPATKKVVDKWNAIADQSMMAEGFDPHEIISTFTESYDGREESVRYTSTNLTRMIAKAFSAAMPETDCTIYNSGMIRIDDEIKGNVTQYDVIRMLPYGGKLVTVQMKGSMLDTLLTAGITHPGDGSFLQYDRVIQKNGKWYVNGKLLKSNKVYRVAVNDYLASGKQTFLEFLNKDNPRVLSISYPESSEKFRNDLRLAVINYLRNGGS
ncbi:MAG: bifunctional metallophosphatase/5'-nucleotidase [Chitinophagales bacterium]|nr:bifunctional metallophosphatase/5'-nucleotidase [Chitinophagales bacterium]